ncbi:MAG: hypothetical protein AVDCRST_MAG68-4669 [uncultured Gemmatimonadetes bacterium]|uniref:Uncharacterized protein n=1 Tax=uncultured Gemmatimonadota bacterium TaxID=203437 RepID=A0A6J4MPN8_9BACT|nr:MAG: hypothetical protein AVDCRST_MAG68-4669 [uncultured Gemmatimonadota bacterium]
MRRSLIYAGAAITLLAVASEGHAQEGSGLESAFHRARAAATLRDSVLRLPNGLSGPDTVLPAEVREFLQDPYRSTAVTLEQLESAQTRVNRALRAVPPDTNALDFFKGRMGAGTAANLAAGVGTPAMLATGGAAALPMLAEGAARFFVQRAQDEAVFAFVISLREGVKNDTLLGMAFPRSHQLVQRIEGETYQSLTPLLRSAFLSDLDALPSRSHTLVDRMLRDSAAPARERVRAYLQGISIVYERGREIRSGAAPSVVLARLAEVDASRMADPNTRSAIRVVGLLAREYSAAGGAPMIEEFASRDRGWLRRYFVALVGHDLLRVDAVPRRELMARLAAREAEAIALLNQLHSIRGELGQLRADAAGAAQALRENPVEQGISAAGVVLGVLRTAPRFAFLPGDTAPAEVQRFEELIGEAIQLHQAVSQKDYATLVSWLAENPRFRFCGNPESDRCRARMRFVALSSSLATARDSREVTEALQAASSGVGSYRAKRGQASRWDAPRTWAAPRTASLVGYVGGGHYGETGAAGSDGGWKAALPVGPEVSFGMPGGAISLFVPLVDLGPVIFEAFDGEDAGEHLERKLFAPGVAVVLNLFRNFPLSVGGGVTSAYHEDEEGAGSRRARPMFFVGIDATLFHRRF